MPPLWQRPKTADGIGLRRNVSFFDDSPRQPSANSGRSGGPSSIPSRSSSQRVPWSDQIPWQRINRQGEAIWHALSRAENRPFLVYDDIFLKLLGPDPQLELLIEDQRAPFFHEAGVFHPPTNTLFITSNHIPDKDPGAVSTANKTIVITKIEFFGPKDFTRDKVRCPEHNYMANGGVNYRDGVLFCAQGSLNEPGGLIYMEAKRPHKTTPLLNNYHGRQFNSPNDVVAHSDGSIWFTDPIYGYEQGFRPPPQLPQQVYRFDPESGGVRVVADGFGRPNGICFSPGEDIVYVTDTDFVHGDGTTDLARASTIYAFDIVIINASPFLINRRVFAMADTGAPDGIKCDVDGNVYSGCGDGVNVWSSGGSLIGKILVDGGVANFCFGREGEMWLLNEHRLWRAKLADGTKGALLRI